jgi:cyclophilin family peptidyl-prolyl cis-trans isomerase
MIAPPSLHRPSSSLHRIEPLEARIAPALTLVNPLGDIIAGAGSKGATIDLSEMFDIDAEHPNHTLVRFVTSYINPDAPAQKQEILIELFDDEAPLTVQNFLGYVTDPKAKENYEGTFFHRAISGFVLQGGGFDAKTRSHIDVDLPVHNEFSATRSNLAGTIAVAKVENDPNSGTSEFFVNLGDNSSNLDNQNGGFTVFGRVLTGMDVINAIAALPKANAGNSGNDTPVQNYDPDPDHNPGTPPPPVKRSSLITIEDVEVINEKGNAAGITFHLPATGAVTDSNGQPSDLVTAQIVGTDLQLKYNTDKSGVVKVKVEATQDGTTVTDEFSVTIKPNVVASIVGDSFSPLIVGGDSGKAKIRIGNNGAAKIDTTVNVKFFLSLPIPGTDPQGVLFDDTDQLIGEITGQRVVLAGGEIMPLIIPVEIAQKLVEAEKVYRVIAKVEPGVAADDQLFADDDNAINGRQHLWSNRFGDFEIQNIKRTNVSLTYAEADGDLVKLSVKGKGTGNATLDGTDVNIAVAGTNGRSVFQATPRVSSGRVDLHNIDITDSLGVAQLASVDLDGYFTAASGARAIVLGDIESNSTFSIGSSNRPGSVALTFAHVQDLVLESLVPIKRLRVTDWIDSAGEADQISSPALTSIIVGGNFEADVTITGDSSLRQVRVGGSMNDSTITTAGDIGTVKVGGMHHSNFFAGVTGRVDTAAELRDAGKIREFVVTGAGAPSAFTDSNVVAQALGRVVLTGVDGQSAADEFGIIADRMEDYLRSAGSVRIAKHHLDDPAAFTPTGEADRTGNFVARIV